MKSKKPTKVAGARRPKNEKARTPWNTRAVLSAAGAIAVGGGSIATGVLGVPYVMRDTNGRLIRAEQSVRVAWPESASGGTWMPADMRDSILLLVSEELAASRDVISRQSLSRVGEALVETGWFVGTPTVARERGGVVSVTGVWRTPAAVVRHQGRDRLISWSGELLPVEYAIGESPLIAIIGVTQPPPRDTEGRLDHGRRWESDSLKAALDLLRLLTGQPYSGQVGAIDVSGLGGGDNRIVIVTDKGSRVVFGTRPGVNAVDRGEVTVPRRLENLAELFRMTGRIDANLPHVEVFRQHVLLDRRTLDQPPNPANERP